MHWTVYKRKCKKVLFLSSFYSLKLTVNSIFWINVLDVLRDSKSYESRINGEGGPNKQGGGGTELNIR